MAEDYKGSSSRHWNDGKVLEAGSRHDNADQLYGFAAECAIKHAISVSTGGTSSGPRVHVNKLWHSAALQSVQRAFLPLYALLKSHAPFDDWDVAQRYWATGSVTPAALAAHRKAAGKVLSAAGFLV